MTTLPKATEDSSEDLATGREAQDRIIATAIQILNTRLFQRGPLLGSPTDVQRYLQLQLMPADRELFAVVFLDAGHRVLAYEVLSHGSLTRATVYPREVLQRALAHNAAALILAHNNPSGRAEPSTEDITLTCSLKDLLPQLDVEVLDHFVIGQGEPFSFAEHGMM
jgi:DNA repair protein RadC